MKRHYRRYTDEDVIKYAAESLSLNQLLKKLGLRAAGGNFDNMKRILQRLKINCDHWTGQGWNKDQQLKDWTHYKKGASIKKHLIRDNGHQCEQCKNESWLGESIPLEIHHKDGDRTNNTLDNLLLLCCNCHALTPNWRARKMSLRAE